MLGCPRFSELTGGLVTWCLQHGLILRVAPGGSKQWVLTQEANGLSSALARSRSRGRTPGVDAFGSSRWLASGWGRRRRGLLLVAVLAPVLGAEGAEGYGVGVLV